MSDNLTPEQELAALEGPRQRFEQALNEYNTVTALPEGHPEVKALKDRLVDEAKVKLEKAHADLQAHKAQHGENLSTKIAAAAQKVLDERGEAHTEENTLHARKPAQAETAAVEP